MPLRHSGHDVETVQMLGVAVIAVIPAVIWMIVLLLLGLVALRGTPPADRAAILRAILGRGDAGSGDPPR